MQTIDSLNKQFALPRVLPFEAGNNQLVRAVLTTPLADAHVYLHGANITHYQPRGQRPVLFLSAKSHFQANKPIRGGVPICFPWFGANANDPNAPMHGTARLNEWAVESAASNADGSVTLTLVLAPCRYRVTVGRALRLSLDVNNASVAPLWFEEALHSYFAVSDARQVSIEGLAGTDYLDKFTNFQPRREGKEPIRLVGETDRIYLKTTATCVINDPDWSRRIVIEKSGSDSTVVWNPWIEKARALPDFGDDEWPGMVCIETCNVKQHAITLLAGQSHTIQGAI